MRSGDWTDNIANTFARKSFWFLGPHMPKGCLIRKARVYKFCIDFRQHFYSSWPLQPQNNRCLQDFTCYASVNESLYKNIGYFLFFDCDIVILPSPNWMFVFFGNLAEFNRVECSYWILGNFPFFNQFFKSSKLFLSWIVLQHWYRSIILEDKRWNSIIISAQ